MDPDAPVTVAPPSPPIWRWVIGFLAVGACWGLTTPFMRRAAVIREQQPKQARPYLTSDAPWVKRKIWGILYAVIDLLKNPAYAVPLLLNVTGSVWFFLLIGQAGMILLIQFSVIKRFCGADNVTELSLTVPITNSLAFLFTVLGEWWAEGKVISRGRLHCRYPYRPVRCRTDHITDTWVGMTLVLGGIALCVHAKTS